MKIRNLILLSVILYCSIACKKEVLEDPRDAFIGTYQMECMRGYVYTPEYTGLTENDTSLVITTPSYVIEKSEEWLDELLINGDRYELVDRFEEDKVYEKVQEFVDSYYGPAPAIYFYFYPERDSLWFRDANIRDTPPSGVLPIPFECWGKR